MSKPTVLPVKLTSSEGYFFEEIAARFPNQFRVGREGEAVTWVEKQVVSSGSKLSPLLRNLERLFDRDADALHISGLELPDLPPTPDRYQPSATADVWPFDIVHLALASLLGRCYGSGHVRGGRILADIFPRPGFESKKDSALGCGEEFDFHSDGAVHPDTMPECIALHCLRNPAATPTLLSAVHRSDFDDLTFRRLCEPVYCVFYEDTTDGAHRLAGVPLIEEGDRDGALLLRYYGSRKIKCSIDGESGVEHREAVEALVSTLHLNACPVVLKPGDVLLAKNKKLVHGRPAFSVSSGTWAERRWLRRAYVARDRDKCAMIEASSTRVLSSVHAASKNQ